MEVKSNELKIIVTASDGSELEYDKELNRVTLLSSCNYATFVKLVKGLKRAKNRQSFIEDFED